MKADYFDLFDRTSYRWTYCSLGGSVRVKISTGDDIAHIGELDKKLWTVLSCPVAGIHFNRKTLAYLDSEKDGKIKADEVIAAAKWVTSMLKDSDLLLESADALPLSNINDSTQEGADILALAQSIPGRASEDSVTVKESESFLAQCSSDDDDVNLEMQAAVDAVAGKIDDYFIRCRLIAFDDAVADAVDFSVDNLRQAANASLMNAGTAAIVSAPIARPSKDAVLSYDAINPAWQEAFSKVRGLVLDKKYPGAGGLNEEQWNAAKAEVAAGTRQPDSGKIAVAAALDRLVHFNRYFYAFLRNYITFTDFYSPQKNIFATFEEGRLYIDQRCCKLCIRVEDMNAHADMAALSGMYLIYCHCTRKDCAPFDIAAVLTDGDVRNLRPGVNAVFYDRDAREWNAVVTKTVDNPISLYQAFWSPYRKFINFVSEKIKNRASDSKDAVEKNLQTASASVSAIPAGGAAGADAQKMPFDIAKFAGIFAAIGMAIGYIGAFITEVVTGVTTASIWETLGVIAGIIIIISGPSCLLAGIKLHKRNLGPVLNANGWAMNAAVTVNILFGKTLTSVASYPNISVEDPFAKKKTPWWQKLLVVIGVLAIIAACLYFSGTFDTVISHE